MIWCRFAAFCINLGQSCCVLHEFGVVLLRSALIWGRFAAFCIDLGPFRCVLHKFGVGLLSFSSSFWEEGEEEKEPSDPSPVAEVPRLRLLDSTATPIGQHGDALWAARSGTTASPFGQLGIALWALYSPRLAT